MLLDFYLSDEFSKISDVIKLTNDNYVEYRIMLFKILMTLFVILYEEPEDSALSS